MTLLDDFKAGLGTVVTSGTQILQTKLTADAQAKTAKEQAKALAQQNAAALALQNQQVTQQGNDLKKWIIPAALVAAVILLAALIFARKRK